jgi:K+-transporting ATPase ATPase A chain
MLSLLVGFLLGSPVASFTAIAPEDHVRFVVTGDDRWNTKSPRAGLDENGVNVTGLGRIVMAILAVFVAGLMVGRTPEYLGNKIEARDMKLAMLAVLVLPLAILGFTSAAALLPAALDSLANSGRHGLSELLYAYSSAAVNNGSAFAGLNANTPWFNTTLGIAMLLGRFAYVVPVMGIAGAIAAKKKVAASAGTFPTDGTLFIGLLVAVILILGGLHYFPALALGPIVEHGLMLAGKTF